MLLNICCAPCGLPIIEYLIKNERPALFFYGPNIFPREEYLRRFDEAKKAAALYDTKLFEGEYDHNGWLSYLKENLPDPPESYLENGKRCLLCFQFRLNKTAVVAKENGFDAFATTLSVSRFKDTAFINQYGRELADKYQLKYETFPLNAAEAHRKGLELSKKHGIYRQKYCGCEFSLGII